jgi:hypothetical protein
MNTSAEPGEDGAEGEARLEREIRQGRKFSPEEAIGRLAGSGAMKGASAVSRVQEAEIEVGTWLRSHVSDPVGALQSVLERQLKGSRLLLDQPAVAVRDYCKHLIVSDNRLEEIVRAADVEWGRRMDERPHFEREGSPADPDDPYTIESVRKALAEALACGG